MRWRELTAAGHDAAVTALRDLAAGRALLLAEVAGILEAPPRSAARPRACRDAGADREAIPAWMRRAQPEGSRERAAVLGAMHAREPSAPDTVAPSVGSHKPVRKR